MSKLNPSLKPTPKVVDERLAGGSGSFGSWKDSKNKWVWCNKHNTLTNVLW